LSVILNLILGDDETKKYFLASKESRSKEDLLSVWSLQAISYSRQGVCRC